MSVCYHKQNISVTLEELWKHLFTFQNAVRNRQSCQEKNKFLEMANNKTVKLVDGHYSNALLLKNRSLNTPNNRRIAEQRALNLKRRFIRDAAFYTVWFWVLYSIVKHAPFLGAHNL